MAQVRTTGLEHELAAEKAADAVTLDDEARERVEAERAAERRAQLDRLERESKED